MDKRLILNKRQAKVVDRIKDIFDELQKEGVAFGIDFAENNMDINCLRFINAQECELLYGGDILDWDDPRRSCAYVDEHGRYIEPEDELFNADEIYYSPIECDFHYIIDIGYIYMDDKTIEVHFKD